MDRHVVVRAVVAVVVALAIIVGVGLVYTSRPHAPAFYPTPTGKPPVSMVLTGTAR